MDDIILYTGVTFVFLFILFLAFSLFKKTDVSKLASTFLILGVGLSLIGTINYSINKETKCLSSGGEFSKTGEMIINAQENYTIPSNPPMKYEYYGCVK